MLALVPGDARESKGGQMRGRLLRTGLAVAAISVAMTAPAYAHGSESDVDTTALPVGETVTEPTVGGLWSCQTEFQTGQAGASTEGPWFNGDGTWDATEKYVVDGDVEWPDAELTIKRDGGTRVITTNDLPTDHTTGEFPVSEDDDAYSVDRNPNSISEQSFAFEIDAKPELADEPTCVGGEIGILKSGVLLFNAVDAGGRDAVAYEVQDQCDGHPQQSSVYHYHSASECVLDALDSGTGQSKLIGYALDGFGIYGPRDENGDELTSEDLDECHGITSEVKFNGKKQTIYHYVATVDYPYTVGCYRGTPSTGAQGGGGAPADEQDMTAPSGQPGLAPPPGAGPPPGA
jgi:hypothetical protein